MTLRDRREKRDRRRLRDRGDRETTETKRSRGQQSIASSLWSHGLLGPMVPKKNYYITMTWLGDSHASLRMTLIGTKTTKRRNDKYEHAFQMQFAPSSTCPIVYLSDCRSPNRNGRTDKRTKRQTEVLRFASACLLVCLSACLLAHSLNFLIKMNE